MAALQLTFLGTFAAELDGRALTGFRSVNVQGLLAYLVLEPDRPHARDTLATLFWPDEPTQTARHNLRQSLYQLRQLLGDLDAAGASYLLVTRQTVQFNRNSDYDLDVDRFLDGLERRDLIAAEAIYAGDLLQGFTCDSLPFETWLRRQRERLHRLALNALHDLTGERLLLGGRAHAAAQASARRQLDLEPWRETAHRQLMEALARTGDRVGALAQFDRCAEVLAEELGVAPAPETLALFEAIRDGLLKADDSATTAISHNLPRQTTPFVGRAAELERLLALLIDPAVPLVSLVGIGGMGKTRLALEAARHMLTRADSPYADGIYLVRLAPISDAALVPKAIADAIGLSWPGPATTYADLSDYLQERSLLLIVDNFEHLLAESCDLLITLLNDAPRLQLCVTARQRLSLRGEVSLSVEGLSADHPNGPLESEAAQLFVQTARRVDPDLSLSGEDEQAIARICRLTEGMPLAIVLAAAWVDTLPPARIAAEIESDRDFLAAEMADLPSRQRSIRAAYAYTWTLLSDEERLAFAQLSVFRGTFTRRAAREIVRTTLPVLAQLVRKSLVTYNAAAGNYHVHELLRQFAAEYLAAGWQTVTTRPDVVRDAHSRYYLTAIADRVADMAGVDQKGALHDIALDYENVRTAWRWAVEQGQIERLHQALDGLFYYHYFSGRELEGVTEFERARARLADLSGGHGALAASADLLQARLRNREHELAHLIPTAIADDLEDQISYFRAHGERFEEALALNRLAGAAVQRRDVAAALRIYQEQLALFEACGDALQQGFCLTNVAQLAILSGQIEMGLQAAQRALALQAQQGDRLGASVVHLTLGAYEVLWTGDFAAAARHYAQARAVGEEMRVAGHLTTGVVMSHAYEGFLALIAGDLDAAQTRAAEAAQLAALKNTPYAVALSQGLAGLLAVTAGDGAQARDLAMRALRLSTQPGAAELAQLGLALAACAAGDATQALNIVRLQWTVSVGLLKLPSRSLLLFFLPVVIWLLKERGRVERAVEVAALGRAQAHCPHGWWDKLGLLVELERCLNAELPPGVYRAAQVRGQQLAFAAAAEALLGELHAL